MAPFTGDTPPGPVTVLVITDGQGISSREWSNQAVCELIAQQESQYGWDFVFLRVNMDAVNTGSQMGFEADKSLTVEASSADVSAAFSAVVDYQNRKRAYGMQQVSGCWEGDSRRARL